ncbi:MAG: flagellar hook-basal body complex protein [Spartobacteria bacterium]|nr:flagellar hook-basal body complex protein [Spartobacteria bacterium]
MIGSMWDGVSGLMTHQQRMDVIGNDIANVNTVAFKESNVTFKEQLVNTLNSPTANTLGKQIGMGVMMGSISRNFRDGVLTSTERSTNIAIGGDGFFQVQDAAGGLHYTRAGEFTFVTDGNNPPAEKYLKNSSGNTLCDGAGQPIAFPAGAANDIIDFAIATDGTVTGVDVTGAQVALGQVQVARFANNNGLSSIGHNMYDVVDEASGPAQFGAPGDPGYGALYQGYLENSNVDLAKEFTEMIITQRGFQANSRSITTGDEMLQEIMSLKR